MRLQATQNRSLNYASTVCGIAHLGFKYQQKELALESRTTKKCHKNLFMLMPPSRLQYDAVVYRQAVETDGGRKQRMREQLVGA